MKHEVEFEKKTLRIKDLKNTDHVGFKSDSRKWEVINIDRLFYAICDDPHADKCNWEMSNSGAESVMVCVSYAKDIVIITELYKFDTRKELYQWLSED